MELFDNSRDIKVIQSWQGAIDLLQKLESFSMRLHKAQPMTKHLRGHREDELEQITPNAHKNDPPDSWVLPDL